MLTKKLLLAIMTVTIFLAAICIPVYFQLAEPYFAPTAMNGINIYEHGNLVDSSAMNLAKGRLAGDLKIEESYPLPGILTASLIAVTGLPYTQVAYLPLAGLGALLYFILGRYILHDKMNIYAALLAVVYFGFAALKQFQGQTNGRAILGAIVTLLFVYSFLRLLGSPKGKFFSYLHWLIICLITAGMAGGTHYTAALTVIAITVVSFATPQNRFSIVNMPRGLCIFAFAIVLFLAPPILSSLAPDLSIHSLVSHILDIIKERLGKENTGLQEAFLQTDMGSKVRLWSLRIITLLSSISVVIIFIWGIVNKKQRDSRQWLYSVIIIGILSTAIPYLLKSSYINTKDAYTFLCAMCLLFQFRKYKIFGIAVTILVVVFTLTNLNFTLQGGSFAAKPFAAEKTQPIAAYLSQNISNSSVVADAGYGANIWLHLANQQKNSTINVSPIGQDALLLNKAQLNSFATTISALERKKMDYLLLNIDGKPFYGDTWGYSVNLHRGIWLENLPLNTTYDDGRFVLCKTK